MKHTEMSRSGRIQVPVIPRRQSWFQHWITMLRLWFTGRPVR